MNKVDIFTNRASGQEDSLDRLFATTWNLVLAHIFVKDLE